MGMCIDRYIFELDQSDKGIILVAMLCIAGNDIEGISGISWLIGFPSQSNFDRSPIESLLRDEFVFLLIEIISDEYGNTSCGVPSTSIFGGNCFLGRGKCCYHIWACFHIPFSDFVMFLY